MKETTAKKFVAVLMSALLVITLSPATSFAVEMGGGRYHSSK